MDIKVLGTGCTNCKNTITLIDQVAKAKGVTVHLEKVEELRDIMGSEISLISPEGHTTPFGTMPRIVSYRIGAIFEIGPAFRADPSFTSRHATEFTSVDAEMSWVESHEDVMAMHESVIVAGLTEPYSFNERGKLG
mgnify:CR=1 FL=1